VLGPIDLQLRRGEIVFVVGDNGSGKTTLIKLLAGLYTPTSGRVLVDGLPVADWDPAVLRRRIGVIFQDFVRYQLTVGENIGAGDDRAYDDRARWTDAAEKGLAAPVIAELPSGFDTQLGKWFKDGRELSGGQWQKIALSRAFMRHDADILVLDEPTAAMDAAAEAEAKIEADVLDLQAHYRMRALPPLQSRSARSLCTSSFSSTSPRTLSAERNS
jgi:ATP-binding cassette subfamily B protein